MNRNLNKFIELVQDNPDLPVIPMVDETIVADYGYSRWMSSIGKSYVDEYWHDDEEFHFKSSGSDEVEEKIIENVWLNDENVSDEELDRLVELELEDIEWTKAIFLNIDLP